MAGAPGAAPGSSPCRYVRVPLALDEIEDVSALVDRSARADFEGAVLDAQGRALRPEDAFPRCCRVVAISDTHCLHGQLHHLPRGDVLVHCGDFTNTGSAAEYSAFEGWLSRVAAPRFGERIFCILGNHDAPARLVQRQALLPHAQVLKCQLAKQRLLPAGMRLFGLSWPQRPPAGGLPEPRVDVLLTHSPPGGLLDANHWGAHSGDREVAQLLERHAPRLHLFGHIHEAYGEHLSRHGGGRCSLLLNVSNAARPLDLPPVVPECIQYPVTVIDLELPPGAAEPPGGGARRRRRTPRRLRAGGRDVAPAAGVGGRRPTDDHGPPRMSLFSRGGGPALALLSAALAAALISAAVGGGS